MRHTLFAPWRMEFIENHDAEKECVLCKIPNAKMDAENHLIFRGKYCYVIMNKFPYSHGHLMVIPFRHEKDWTELNRDELLEMNELTQKALRVLKNELEANGFNIGVNLGKAAGAGIEGHVHQHIVPRWIGDFNFMPLLSETKIISEHLDQTYKKLSSGWGKK
ncbi:MAG: histidine triad protein [Bacteriovoracaceae bacterium]|nr:histidine triad protein [Bacteriovoracaceae bacterium]